MKNNRISTTTASIDTKDRIQNKRMFSDKSSARHLHQRNKTVCECSQNAAVKYFAMRKQISLCKDSVQRSSENHKTVICIDPL